MSTSVIGFSAFGFSDMALFGEMNAVWDAWIDPENPPTRACGQVPLAHPDFKVEIIIRAALD